MGNYEVEQYSTGIKETSDEVLSALHAKLETLDDDRDIFVINVFKTSYDGYEGVILYQPNAE